MNKQSWIAIGVVAIVLGIGAWLIFKKPAPATPIPVAVVPFVYDIQNPKEQGNDTNGQHLARITRILETKDGAYDMDVAYAALDDCADEGDDCPNDYHIDTTGTQSRTFIIDPDTEVRLQTYAHDEDGALEFNHQVSLNEFIGLFGVETDEYMPEDLYYWITIKDGQVIGITEQYQP